MAEKSRIDTTREFFERLKDRPEGRKALRLYDWTFQFRISGEAPFYMDIKNGEISISKGDISKRDWRTWTAVETDKDTLESIYRGYERAVDMYFSDKLYVSGLVAKRRQGIWLFCMLRLGQVKNYSEYLNSNYEKAWLRSRRQQTRAQVGFDVALEDVRKEIVAKALERIKASLETFTEAGLVTKEASARAFSKPS